MRLRLPSLAERIIVPALAVAVVVGLIIVARGFLNAVTPVPVERAPYEPIDLLPLCLANGNEPGDCVPAQTVELGSLVTLHNGICTDEAGPFDAYVYLGLQEDEAAPLRSAEARRIDIIGTPINEKNEGGEYAPLRPPAPGEEREGWHDGCIAERITKAVELPPEWAGRWRLVAQIVVIGPNSGDVQRLSETSPPFALISSDIIDTPGQ